MLLKEWPALTKFYGIYPWHVTGGPPVLSFGETYEYAAQFAEYLKERKKEADDARRVGRRRR